MTTHRLIERRRLVDEFAGDARTCAEDDAEAFAAWMHARGPRVFAPADVARLYGATVREMRGCATAAALAARGCGETLGARIRMARAIREIREENDGKRAKTVAVVTIDETRGVKATRVAPVFDREKAKWGGGGGGDAEEDARRDATNASTAARAARGKKAPSVAERTTAPAWIRPPGTKFIVDGFEYAGAKWCEHWFLTHFHADHHRGLTKTFDRGYVYGTKTTLDLVKEKLGVDPRRLRLFEIGVTRRLEGVDVTFIEANHCPGAAMILFEFPTRPTASPVLHTGDFRFHERMRDDPTLQRITSPTRKVSPILILDTTYCSLEHDDFPSQETVLKAVKDALVHEDNLSARKLFLFGSYTIGKEKVFFEAAKTLNRKVYIGKAKRSVMDAIALSPEEKSAMTFDDSRTNLHVVPMGSTSFMKMASILKYYKKRFDTVIAFRPTGWTFSANAKTRRATARRQRGKLVQYGLPYSEHSSLNELRAFVDFIQPRIIFPHVGNDCGEKTQHMLRLLRATDDELAALKEKAR